MTSSVLLRTAYSPERVALATDGMRSRRSRSAVVANAGVPVQIAKEGQPPVNARSLLNVLTLGVEYGELVTLYAEGEGADGALDQLAAMLGRELDE